MKLHQKKLFFVKALIQNVQIALHLLHRILTVYCVCFSAEGGHIDRYLQILEAKFLLQRLPFFRVEKDLISRIALVNVLALVQIIQHVGAPHFFLHKHIGKKQVIGHEKISHYISHAVTLLHIVPAHAF